ncbi:MAG: glycosyltransferase family 4 protein [Chloroflexota bacterium]
MRILYAGNFEWPSEQARAIQTVHTGHALARAGADVKLVTIRARGRQPSVPRALALYGLSPHPRFASASVPVIRVPESLRIIEIHKRLAVTNFSFCLGAALDIARCQRHQRPDWIFTRDPRVAWTFIKLRPITGARVVYEVHELFGTRPRDNRSLDRAEQWGVANRTRALESTVLHEADRLITLTQACRQLIVDAHGIPESRIRMVPDGTRLPPERHGPGRLARSIFYVGQLYRWKGVDTLIRALTDIPAATLTIIGAGAQEGGRDVDRARLKHLVQDLGIAERVSFQTFVPYEQVPALLAQAAVATVPLPDVLMSRYFTSPLKIFDAMAAGTPIVASRLDSICEILTDSENSVLVEPDSPTALAAGIRRILDNPRLAESLASRARLDVMAYTWDARARRILDFLEVTNSARLDP